MSHRIFDGRGTKDGPKLVDSICDSSNVLTARHNLVNSSTTSQDYETVWPGPLAVPLVEISEAPTSSISIRTYHSNQYHEDRGSWLQHLYLSESCQSGLMAINGIILVIVSVLIIIDVWDLATGSDFLDSKNILTRTLTIAADWVITVVLALEISLRFAASRSSAWIAAKRLGGDLIVLAASVGSLVVESRVDFTTVQRKWKIDWTLIDVASR